MRLKELPAMFLIIPDPVQSLFSDGLIPIPGIIFIQPTQMENSPQHQGMYLKELPVMYMPGSYLVPFLYSDGGTPELASNPLPFISNRYCP
jgi:hypothetical protein